MEQFNVCFGIEGDSWFCHIEGFGELAEHTFGFGDTKKEALEKLIEQLGPDLQ